MLTVRGLSAGGTLYWGKAFSADNIAGLIKQSNFMCPSCYFSATQRFLALDTSADVLSLGKRLIEDEEY